MFFPCSSGEDDIIDKGCDTRLAVKHLVHFPLEFILNADDPNGNQRNLYRPHRVLKVAKYEDYGRSFSCQYPDRASNLLKNLALVIFDRASLSIGME